MIRRILRDYFGYEVNFVMNVTDIEDKVSLVSCSAPSRASPHPSSQIIIRAREQHLLEAYRKNHPNLSDSLKSDVKQAWDAYFQSKLVKCLAEADKPKDGEDLVGTFERLVKRDASDETWRKEVRAKEEKFGLILGSLVSFCLTSLFVAGLMMVSPAIRSNRSRSSQRLELADRLGKRHSVMVVG